MKVNIGRFLSILVVMLVAIVTMGGCGGSSSSGGTGSNFNVFATDDANNDYSGVWVKVFKVDVQNSTGGSVNLLSSLDGLTVNLRALNDGAARFLLLCPGKLADGTYTKVSFELDKSVTLIAKNTGTVSTANFPDSLDATISGHSTLNVNLVPNLVVPGSAKVIIDFDLKNWTVSGGVITPVLTIHSGAGFEDGSRHESFEFGGTVSELTGTAPVQTFTLTLKSGGTVTVATTDQTSVVSDNNTTAISNGMKVEVFGALDPTTGTLTAKIIRAESEFEGDAKAVGTASSADANAKTFLLVPSFTRGFAPQGANITVTTNSTTHFRGHHGAQLTEAQFYAAIANANASTIVETEGTFDVASNTLVAKNVHIENETEQDQAEARGTVSISDLATSSFDLNLTESEGFTPPNGPLHVVATVDALFQDDHGQILTAADFFAAISSTNKSIKVKGTYSNSVFTASRIEIKH